MFGYGRIRIDRQVPELITKRRQLIPHSSEKPIALDALQEALAVGCEYRCRADDKDQQQAGRVQMIYAADVARQRKSSGPLWFRDSPRTHPAFSASAPMSALSMKSKVGPVYIAAARIRFLPWPGPSHSVRAVGIDGGTWFVTADLCRALGYALSSNGKPNVTEALAGVSAEHRCFARLETAPGTFKPYARVALTSASGLIALAARQRVNSTEAVMPETSLYMWIVQAVADVAGGPPQHAENRVGRGTGITGLEPVPHTSRPSLEERDH